MPGKAQAFDSEGAIKLGTHQGGHRWLISTMDLRLEKKKILFCLQHKQDIFSFSK